ncbi:Uncharacterised protein [Yersinia intermedia]|uniref:Uncharacterized protein n=1 Tax=Yersinia intermedia TaxID=631 RepID=A0A0T9N677_YERIN|nr:Uncharacterised protein [Yersinia intermedia]
MLAGGEVSASEIDSPALGGQCDITALSLAATEIDTVRVEILRRTTDIFPLSN